MATKDVGDACLKSRSCKTGFCSPTSGRCEKPYLFQRCNANASSDQCPSSQICDKTTFRCLPKASPPKNKGVVGTNCQDVSECGAGMGCMAGICRFTGQAGEKCDEAAVSKSGPQCKDGTVCFKGMCRDTCYTVQGKDNPDWKCQQSTYKCFATERGVQGVCMTAKPVSNVPQPAPQPIIEPGKNQTPSPVPIKTKPWYQDNTVQIGFGVAAFLIFVLILAISITVCCVKRKKQKQKSRDVEDKKPSIPLDSTIVASAPTATQQQHGMHGSSGMMMAPAMGPEQPPAYHDVASTSSSLNIRMPSSASLGSEKSEKHGTSVMHQTVPTAPESEDDVRQDVSSLQPPRTPSRPPGSF